MYEEININSIRTRSNYRQTFDEKKLKELASSIKEHGIIQPLVLRPIGNKYEIIAGERRFRAAKIAQLVKVPAIIREINDAKFLETQLVENMQREGVQFMEEAFGLKRLRDECDLDTAEICKKVSKSEWYVYMMLKLTDMSETAQAACARGEIGKSVAFIIAKLPTHDQQAKAAVDLRRDRADKLIGERAARHYIEQSFGEDRYVRAPKKSRVQREIGHDYGANWKKNLLTFDAKQFEHFKKILNGKTETAAFAAAVEQVMLHGVS